MAYKLPSQRSIDLYNKLVEQQNKVRKTLRRIHKKAEEALGAGRLPALVIPKSAHKIRRSHFNNMTSMKLKMFWQAYREKKALFSHGLDSYLNKVVVKGYRELWEGEYGIGEKPALNSFGGMYSKEQIENADEDKADAMRAYNGLFTKGPMFFLAMLYTNNVISFKYIYQELYMGTGSKEYSFIDQQIEINNRLSGPKARSQLLDEASYITGYRHPEKIKKEIRKMPKEETKKTKAKE